VSNVTSKRIQSKGICSETHDIFFNLVNSWSVSAMIWPLPDRFLFSTLLLPRSLSQLVLVSGSLSIDQHGNVRLHRGQLFR